MHMGLPRHHPNYIIHHKSWQNWLWSFDHFWGNFLCNLGYLGNHLGAILSLLFWSSKILTWKNLALHRIRIAMLKLFFKLLDRNLFCIVFCQIGKTTDNGHPMEAQIKEIWNFGLMWQTKYAPAIPKNLGLGFDFWPCREGDFLTGRP